MSYTNETQWGSYNSQWGSYNSSRIDLERVKIDPEKAAWENNVKKIKAEQAYAERIASVASKKKIIPEYLQTAMKNRDEAKHIYESARELSKPMLKYTGYDIPSFKRAIKHQNEEIVAYKTMLETLQKELTDAENILLEEQGRYYSLKKEQ
jgi:hypothetical protein